MTITDSLGYFVPEIFLLCGAFLAIILDLFVKNKKAIGLFAILVLIATGLLAKSPDTPMGLFFGFFHLDSFTHFFRLTALGIVAITILISLAYKPLMKSYEGEYYSLFLFMAFALILMAASTNLLALFLHIEFVSILSYLLVGFLKKDGRSKEAAIKYLLFGSLATGIMLYGMSLLYGATGSLDLETIQTKIPVPSYRVLNLASLFMLLAGLGFKISMAPFHMWAPDVYEAAPTPVAAFLTVGPKAIGFAVLYRILNVTFSGLSWKWAPLLVFFSILTMTLGNIIAISQSNIKRLLAYSSIAQAGYILMGLAAFNEIGLSGVLIYLLAYAITNLGAFTVVIYASNVFGNDLMESYAGLGRRAPGLAAALTLFLLSLAGLPPFAGFIGKFFVFSGAIQGSLYVLAIAAAINSAIAAFYYFRVVRLMYLVPATHHEPIPQSFPLSLALALLVVGVILLGIYPSPVIALVKSSLLI